MIKPSCLFTAFLIIVTASCKKSTSSPAPGDNTAPGLLIKKVRVIESTNRHTTETLFKYDSENRLIQVLISINTSASPGLGSVSDTRYYRDTGGRIIKIAKTPVRSPSEPADTSYYIVVYETPQSSRVVYTLGKNQQGGKTMYDSTAYTYDTNSDVIKTTQYESNDWPAIAPTITTFKNRNFDGSSNVLRTEYYVDPTAGQIIVLEYVYDNKTNPLYANDDVRVDELVSKNNITSVKTTAFGVVETFEGVYQYNADGKPVSLLMKNTLNPSHQISEQYSYSK